MTTVDRRRSGSVLVEFAMLILPLLVLIFGVIEYGRLQWTRGALQQVAIEGARCAGLRTVSCSTSIGTDRVYDAARTLSFVRARAANWYVGLTASDIVVTASTVCDGAADLVQVRINYTFRSPFAPLPTATWPITASACFPNRS